MRAITIAAYGGPDVLQKRSDAPIPVAGPDDVLVRVVCAGINFMDIHTRQGKYAQSRTYPVRLPCTLGMEGAGEVVAIGNDVRHLVLADRVAWCIAWGSYADYAAIPARFAARIADDVTYEAAAAAMFQGCTAHYLIEDVARLQADDTCLVHAASGSIGQILIQMAKQRGATVFATASTADKRKVAQDCGADHTMAYDDGRFADTIREATHGIGVDVVFDSLGLATLRDSMRAARTSGLIVNYGNVSGSVRDLDPIELGEAGSLFLTRPRLADHMRDAVTVQRRADAIFDAMRKGTLRIDVAARYTLDDVDVAHARIEGREQVGKAVVCIG